MSCLSHTLCKSSIFERWSKLRCSGCCYLSRPRQIRRGGKSLYQHGVNMPFMSVILVQTKVCSAMVLLYEFYYSLCFASWLSFLYMPHSLLLPFFKYEEQLDSALWSSEQFWYFFHYHGLLRGSVVLWSVWKWASKSFTFLQQELALYEDEALVNRQVCISAAFELISCTIMLTNVLVYWLVFYVWWLILHQMPVSLANLNLQSRVFVILGQGLNCFPSAIQLLSSLRLPFHFVIGALSWIVQ